MFRLNCSHLATAELPDAIATVRAAAPFAAVLVDVQGPKLRTAQHAADLRPGTHVTVAGTDVDPAAAPSDLTVAFDLAGVEFVPGARLLLDDGKVDLSVVAPLDQHRRLRCVVVVGGVVGPRKGVHIAGADLPGALTAKDLADLEAAVALGADWVAVSFVQSAADVETVKALVGPDVAVLAKIERASAVADLDRIADAADGVMVARGDLGVELGYTAVPAVQRKVAEVALRTGIVSVCATEMLESMIHQSRPTRAEVNDVATAVRDHFDAVMCSAETAVGHDPVGAVAAMAAICAAAPRSRPTPAFARANRAATAVVAAAGSLATQCDATAIVSLTATGYSAALLAATRPAVPVVAVCPVASAARRLQVRWGVHPVVAPRPDDVVAAIDLAVTAACDAGLVVSGDRVVVCASRRSPRSDADTVWLHEAP
jgi:pyruvate kinase